MSAKESPSEDHMSEKFLDVSNVFSSHCYTWSTVGDTDSYKLIGCNDINCTTEWFHTD